MRMCARGWMDAERRHRAAGMFLLLLGEREARVVFRVSASAFFRTRKLVFYEDFR